MIEGSKKEWCFLTNQDLADIIRRFLVTRPSHSATEQEVLKVVNWANQAVLMMGLFYLIRTGQVRIDVREDEVFFSLLQPSQGSSS